MIRIKITERGINFAAGDEDERELEVGEELVLEVDSVPGSFLNKCIVLVDSRGRDLETGSEDDADPDQKVINVDNDTDAADIAGAKALLDDLEVEYPTDATLDQLQTIYDNHLAEVEAEEKAAEEIAAVKAQLDELGVAYPEVMSLEALTQAYDAAIEKARLEGETASEAAADQMKAASLEDLKKVYADLGGKAAKENWGMPAYTKAIAELEADGGNDKF